MIEITYENGSMHVANSIDEAEGIIIMIYNETGMVPDYIEDTSGQLYSCFWEVSLQKI